MLEVYQILSEYTDNNQLDISRLFVIPESVKPSQGTLTALPWIA